MYDSLIPWITLPPNWADAVGVIIDLLVVFLEHVLGLAVVAP